ncbi:minor capsid protein [Oenococcus sicerae]|uniref:minor capsid protein n=1 Tax=Oenococcus sicerae TaxID=2203724 RepID=UPI0039E98B13
MDLDDRLCMYICDIDDTTKNCGLGFVPANGQLSLQLDPGSKPIQTYYNGDQDLAVNFELSTSNDSYVAARTLLNLVIDKLTELETGAIQSSDGSFDFDRIETAGLPFNQVIDTTGKTYWITNFIAYVTKHKN